MSGSITLRSHLTGALYDVVEAADLGALGKCSVVCEMVSLFVDYQEEGASLFLDAFITNKISDLISMIPDSAHLMLGKSTCDEAGIRMAVKKSAPLVRGCWRMYIAPDANGIEFGLFRDSAHPLNVPIDLILQTGGEGELKFVRVTRLAQDSVRVSTNKGEQVVVHFTNEQNGMTDASDALRKLSKVICSRLETKRAQTIETYLSSMLSGALRACHGALIAVMKTQKIPKYLSDCTALLPPINLANVVDSVRVSSDAIPGLNAAEHLICGMLCCDGIVVFDTEANVLAYNGFIRLEASNAVGGARKRAFEALRQKLGSGLVALYYQSQDGAMDFREIAHE